MDESRIAHGLHDLTDQLTSMTSTVVGDTSIAPPDLRTVLRFISKVVQVADQAFQDVYLVLMDVQFLRQDDLSTDHLIEVERALASLMARSRYRDAEEICSRLHHLAEEYSRTIQPIVVNVANEEEWFLVFRLLDEYEGKIIYMVREAVYELEQMVHGLRPVISSSDLLAVTQAARERAMDVRSALLRLEELRNQILGLSGEPGLMALISSSDRDRAAKVTVRSIRIGDTYNARGVGAVGPSANASNFTINQTWQNLQNHDTRLLARDLVLLRAELKKQAVDAEQDITVAGVAAAQLAAQKGDGPAAISHLARVGKWALDVATSIGATVAAAAIKAAMGI
jgi:hypothetical protein